MSFAEKLHQRNQSGWGTSDHDGNDDKDDDKDDDYNYDKDDDKDNDKDYGKNYGKNDNHSDDSILGNPVIDKYIGKGGAVEGRREHQVLWEY